ncbi:MAG: hypothetical protein LUE24_05800, partial [Lachnospiraceae bacterium]|nr:hypothetical protein [Lachnospiraceae bacterium]
MAGRKFEAGEKKVQKMSREGLTEKNLHTGESISISRKFEGDASERMDSQDEQPVRARVGIDGSGEEAAGTRKRRRQQRINNAEPTVETSGTEPRSESETVQVETIARDSPFAAVSEPVTALGAMEHPSYQAAELEDSYSVDSRQRFNLVSEQHDAGQPVEPHLYERHRLSFSKNNEEDTIAEPVRGKETLFSERSLQEAETAATGKSVPEKEAALTTEPLRETEQTFSGEAVRERSAMSAVENLSIIESHDLFGGYSESILERSREREELREAEPAEAENSAVDDTAGGARLNSHSVRMDRMGEHEEPSHEKPKRRKNYQRQSRKFQVPENGTSEIEAVHNVADGSDSANPIQSFEMDLPPVQAQGNVLRPQEESFYGSAALQDKETPAAETGMSVVSEVSKAQHVQHSSESYSSEVSSGDVPTETGSPNAITGQYTLQTHSARFQAVSEHSARDSELLDVSEAGNNRKRRIRAETARIASKDAGRVEAPPGAEDTRSLSQETSDLKPLLRDGAGDTAPPQNVSDMPALPQKTEQARSMLQTTTNLPKTLSAASGIVPVNSDSAELRPESSDFDGESRLKQQSGRLDNYRESYSRNEDIPKGDESHARKKAQTQGYQRKAERASSEERRSSEKRSDGFPQEEKSNPEEKNPDFHLMTSRLAWCAAL